MPQLYILWHPPEQRDAFSDHYWYTRDREVVDLASAQEFLNGDPTIDINMLSAAS